MRTERKTQTFNAKRTIPISQKPMSGSLYARNLRKNQLGGVIFGCTRSTMKECLSKQLFGSYFTFDCFYGSTCNRLIAISYVSLYVYTYLLESRLS